MNRGAGVRRESRPRSHPTRGRLPHPRPPARGDVHLSRRLSAGLGRGGGQSISFVRAGRPGNQCRHSSRSALHDRLWILRSADLQRSVDSHLHPGPRPSGPRDHVRRPTSVMTRGQQSLFVNVFPGETIRIRSHRLGPQIGLSWIPDESGMNAHELRASSWKTGMLFGGSIGSSGTPPRSRSVAPAFTGVARI